MFRMAIAIFLCTLAGVLRLGAGLGTCAPSIWTRRRNDVNGPLFCHRNSFIFIWRHQEISNARLLKSQGPRSQDGVFVGVRLLVFIYRVNLAPESGTARGRQNFYQIAVKFQAPVGNEHTLFIQHLFKLSSQVWKLIIPMGERERIQKQLAGRRRCWNLQAQIRIKTCARTVQAYSEINYTILIRISHLMREPLRPQDNNKLNSWAGSLNLFIKNTWGLHAFNLLKTFFHGILFQL